MTEPITIIYHHEEFEPSDWQDALKPFLPSVELVSPDDPSAQKAEVFMTWEPPEGMIASFPNLKGVISLAQGVDHIFKDKSFPKHLKLARLVDPYMSIAMAEWVLLAILEQHRDAPAYRAAAQKSEWIRLEPNFASQVTVAIMGLGAIGSVVATKIAAMEFKTIGWSRSKKTLKHVTSYFGEDGFQQCLSEADYIASILPLTIETYDIYNAKTFAMMKKGAYFINSGRGNQVIEEDLIAAIDSGHLKGACLDVTRIEPLPSQSPLWQHPKITIWPHVSAPTSPISAAKQVAEAITAIRKGLEPPNSVDITKGY